MKPLVVIPARGGSKGIPGKNVKPLGGVPLLHWALATARAVAPETDIIVSTDDDGILACARDAGYEAPFRRPAELATDQSGMREVLLHALDFQAARGRNYETILLLQPTSPFRTPEQVRAAIALYRPDLEMVISVKLTDANPYYVLREENAQGFLEPSKKGTFVRRQDCPAVYQINGAVYVISAEALRKRGMAEFERVIKYEMDGISSLDLDTPLDWAFAEFVVAQGLVSAPAPSESAPARP